MIVQCPNCGTKYNLPEERIKPEGAKVRCTRCTHVFQVQAPLSEDAALEQLLENKAAAAARVEGEAHRQVLKDLEGTFQPPLLGEEGKPRLELNPAPKPSGKRSPWLWVGVFGVLAALAVGAVFVLRPSWIPWLAPKPSAEVSTTRPGAFTEEVARIVLENVRQYFVNNEKEGQLFVIEGQAVNRFAEPRELIKLKAALFNAQGAAVATQEFLAGNTVSLYQLQVASRQEIETALGAKVGILTNNTNVQPGRGVPFMVVFFGVPAGVQEFGLEVIQAKTPPQ
ncbi:hypothetical protein TDMWS_14460 [Thermodesulfomicrobium sp. WS]|uniref:DUF3426 domain-containing protein n=1 Tax=Thermodesulfomicrobium sp. WS TaxID=3004129 RepID=UPI002492FC3F|nr:DUF3426 domain-containing protein [Thermodesulfomicrobium sp. WS]BDV01361.1 hypothetical protein TDMWS_14460 [Thermodesulfomicrobium sp. WS]